MPGRTGANLKPPSRLSSGWTRIKSPLSQLTKTFKCSRFSRIIPFVPYPSRCGGINRLDDESGLSFSTLQHYTLSRIFPGRGETGA